MKKINLFIFCFITFISTISCADFNVNFFSSYGFYEEDGLSPLLPNVGDGALVQLVYAGSNNQIDEITDYNLSTVDLITFREIPIVILTLLFILMLRFSNNKIFMALIIDS